MSRVHVPGECDFCHKALQERGIAMDTDWYQGEICHACYEPVRARYDPMYPIEQTMEHLWKVAGTAKILVKKFDETTQVLVRDWVAPDIEELRTALKELEDHMES